MNYTVKPLGPELAGTFTEYLGGLDFGHALGRLLLRLLLFGLFSGGMDEENRAMAVAEANTGSYRVLAKNGFVLEGRLKDYYFIEGRYYDGMFYGFIRW